jgi:hypothetical protein
VTLRIATKMRSDLPLTMWTAPASTGLGLLSSDDKRSSRVMFGGAKAVLLANCECFDIRECFAAS